MDEIIGTFFLYTNTNMSFTNCSISHMVEHEMKHAGYLILSLLRSDDPHALDRFVDKHTRLLSRIEEKQRTVQDAIHVDDLKIEKENLMHVQAALPLIQQKVQTVRRKGRIEVEGYDKAMTMHGLVCWYEHVLDKLIWVVLHPEKVQHCLHEMGTLVHSIRAKSMLYGITPDQHDDLTIMEANASMLYSFVSELSSAEFQGRKRSSKKSGKTMKKMW